MFPCYWSRDQIDLKALSNNCRSYNNRIILTSAKRKVLICLSLIYFNSPLNVVLDVFLTIVSHISYAIDVALDSSYLPLKLRNRSGDPCNTFTSNMFV